MDDIVKKALGKVARYKDPQNPKMDDWKWRPLKDVHAELEGLPEIPSHVEKFGAFMDETANRAVKQGLTPRDLIKAYAITRASIQRRQKSADSVRENGLMLPSTTEKMIRPEGAMGEWLHSPMGQRYLDAAERGKVDEEAVAHAQRVMSPFGLTTEATSLPWAAQVLGPHHKQVGDMVARGLMGKSPTAEWQDFSKKNLHGIGVAKAGFIASLLGRGDMPTFDARQVKLQTGIQKTKEATPMTNKGGFGVIDRLAARQAAMNPKMDPGLEPYRQHLTHHAIWDKAENATTTHDDVMNAMRNAKDGGRIGYSTRGRTGPEQRAHEAQESIKELLDHPFADRLMRVLGVDPKADHATIQKYLQERIERAGSRMADFPARQDIWKINDPDRRAALEAAYKSYDLDPTQNKGGGLYGLKQSMAPTSVEATVGPLPKTSAKTPVSKSWNDALAPYKGGTIIGLGGDRIRVGTLTHINGKPLAWPVHLHGGPGYMLEQNKNEVWNNNPNHAKSLNQMIQEAHQVGPVVGAYNTMGGQSLDSSHNMIETLMAQIPGSNIDPNVAAEFDAIVRSGAHGEKPADKKRLAELMEKWPGIMNPQDATEFMRPENGMSGKARSALVKLMDNEHFRDHGFPMVGETRAAVTEPGLMNVGRGRTGFRLVELHPEKTYMGPRNFDHSGYKGPNYGNYLADVRTLPTEDVMHGYAAALSAKDIKGEGLVHPLSPDPMGRSTSNKLNTEQKGFGVINNRFFDRVGASEEREQAADADRLAQRQRARGGKTKNMERAMSLTSLYALGHDRDAG
jgi:hypothetical protein